MKREDWSRFRAMPTHFHTVHRWYSRGRRSFNKIPKNRTNDQRLSFLSSHFTIHSHFTLTLLFPQLLDLRKSLEHIMSMNLRLILEHDTNCNRWSAFFPELPGCTSAGDSEEEAIANAKEALSLWFEPSESNFSPDSKIVEVALGWLPSFLPFRQEKSPEF